MVYCKFQNVFWKPQNSIWNYVWLYFSFWNPCDRSPVQQKTWTHLSAYAHILLLCWCLEAGADSSRFPMVGRAAMGARWIEVAPPVDLFDFSLVGFWNFVDIAASLKGHCPQPQFDPLHLSRGSIMIPGTWPELFRYKTHRVAIRLGDCAAGSACIEYFFSLRPQMPTVWLLGQLCGTSPSHERHKFVRCQLGALHGFSMVLLLCLLTRHFLKLPVVPHKAVAEISKIGNYRRGELLWWMDGRANPLMDREVAEALSLSLSLSLFLSPSLSIYPFVHISICLSICLSIYLSIFLSIYPSICLFIYLFTYLCISLSISLSLYLSTCLSVYPSICLSIHLSFYLSTWKETIPRDFFQMCIDLSINQSTNQSINLSTCLFIYLALYLSIYQSIYSSFPSLFLLSISLFICLSICLSIRLSIHLSMCLSIGISPRVNTYATLPSNIKIARSKRKQNCKTSSKIQRRQHQQRSTSARLPQLLKFTTSNAKQFCETSFKSGSSKLKYKFKSWKLKAAVFPRDGVQIW